MATTYLYRVWVTVEDDGEEFLKVPDKLREGIDATEGMTWVEADFVDSYKET